MAFDIYVGSFTRYYRQDWENVAQRWARENGIRYNLITPGGEQGPPASAAEISQFIVSWRETLNSSLNSLLSEPLAWNDSAESPYFTNRPGWDGYCALLIWTAYSHFPNKVPPEMVPESWANDCVFQAATSKDCKTPKKQILLPMIWLPCRFDFVFQGPSPMNQEIAIGSSSALFEQLLAIKNSREANPDFQEVTTHVEASDTTQKLKPTAQHALQMFIDMANNSVEHRLPMILSF
jgi:hypothetical protein